MNVKVKLFQGGIMPSYANPGDAGMDIMCPSQFLLDSMERITIPLGVGLEVPDGYVAWLADKSSLPKQLGLHIMGGIIDSSYRGEIMATVVNLSDSSVFFEKGRKIAQILIQPVVRATLEEVQELSPSQRGTGGFGSSGKF